MTLSKYHTLSDSKLIYKLYKIDAKLKRLSVAKNPANGVVRVLPGGVLDMTEDDEPVDHPRRADMERKKKLLRKVLHEKLRDSLASLTQDEIRDKIADLKTVVHSVEGSLRDHQVSSFEEQQRVFFMKVVIAEEIVSELDDDMKCPISYCLMQDPVTTCNGHTYDRKSIMAHIRKCHSTNRSPTEPLTNVEMGNLVLTPNKKLATEIRAAVLATIATFD